MVELVRAGGGISDLSCEFGCKAGSIQAWVKAAGHARKPDNFGPSLLLLGLDQGAVPTLIPTDLELDRTAASEA